MSKFEIMNKVSRKLNKAGFQLKKHSPEILVVAGVVGTVTSAVMACKATTKLSEVLDESKEQVDQIHDYVEENGYSEKYSESDEKKDLTIVYAQTGLKLVKLYAPAVILGGLSITAILTSNNILRQRNLTLAATYAALDKSFKEYRGRVVEKFGENIDRELKYNIKSEEIEETITDKNGKEKTVKKNVDVMNLDEPSIFSRFFDESCAGWTKDPEYNLMHVKRMQDFANDKLREAGHLYLNEVYDMFGIDRTKAGQMYGWVYDEENPIGDNRVDFGIFDGNKPANRRFVNGCERVLLMDFNVDGNILDLM